MTTMFPLSATRFLIACAALAVPLASSAQAPGAWLARPLAGWNQAGVVPRAPVSPGEGRDALGRRCGPASLKGSGPADVLSTAGWVSYRHLDREIAREEVEVLGGMSAAGPGCDPQLFNLFVFVDGRFAGTLSPAPMSPNRDGEAGAVRIVSRESLTAEFARYMTGDPECCPSSRVRVEFRVDRGGAAPSLTPVAARAIR